MEHIVSVMISHVIDIMDYSAPDPIMAIVDAAFANVNMDGQVKRAIVDLLKKVAFLQVLILFIDFKSFLF